MKMKKYATPFSVLHAASLLSHTSRIRKFREAIRRVVRSSDYVIDLGTGSGILSILAAMQGARVTAVDINQDSLQYAKAAAKLNGVAENIEFVNSHFADYYPSEKADVVMCEMLSSIMLVEQQIPASSHAVEHFLKASGHIIPEDVHLFAGPVQNNAIWERFKIEGLSFPRIPQTAESGQSTDLADFSEFAYFNLKSRNANTRVEKTIKYDIIQKGTIHGLQGLFESKLYDDITLRMEDGWKDLFIPLHNPIDVQEGDIIRIKISFTAGEYDSLQISQVTD
jgi:predicted RNA methylase